jgi:zinc transport system substrate-binding protein
VDFLRIPIIIVASLIGFAVCTSATAQTGSQEKTATVMVSAKPLALIYGALQPQQPVEVLLPSDRDMHEYSLSIRDIKRLQSAPTFFWLGAQSEPFLLALQQRFAGQKNWVAIADNTSHAWLDQQQIPVLVNNMAQALVKQNPAEKQAIQARSTALIKAVNERHQYWRQRLQPYTNKPFLLGHDAYTGFAKNIGLQQGLLYRTSNDHGHVQAGMYEILELQKRIAQGEITCAMEEPEVSFATLAKRYPALKLGHLEPMATGIPLQADAYVAFIDSSAQAFETCFQKGVK